MRDLLKVAGYVHGGCSPIGMKKLFTTVIDETAILFDNIIMGWQVWDYSEIPLNFMGQICLSFSLCWYLLSLPLCILTSNLVKKSAE